MFPWMTYPNVYPLPIIPNNKGKRKNKEMSFNKFVKNYREFEEFMEWKSEKDKKKNEKKDDKKPENKKSGPNFGTTEWFVMGLFAMPVLLSGYVFAFLYIMERFGVNLLK